MQLRRNLLVPAFALALLGLGVCAADKDPKGLWTNPNDSTLPPDFKVANGHDAG